MDWRQATDTTLKALIETPKLGLITDMDGTVSHIVDVPDQAQITSRNKALLAELHEHLSLTAVVSGRAAADVSQRVGLPQLVYVGNHGFEWLRDGEINIAPEVAQYRPSLESVFQIAQERQIDGMRVEDKGATLSIHYRQTADPIAVQTIFEPLLTDLAEQHQLNLFQGRMVFEVRPPLEINKGTVFHQLVGHYQLDAAIFMGDDTTDADALLMTQQLRQNQHCQAWGFGVLAADTPAIVRESSDFWLYGVSDVESFLTWVLKERKASFN